MKNGAFPDLSVKNKDEEWHKQYVQAIVKDSINANYDLFNASVTELYNYYNGTQGSADYTFLQETADGDVLPAKWINYNKIRTKVNLLLGEMAEKGFEITAKSINTGSKVRKLEEKRALLTQVRINKDLQELEKGLPLPISEVNLPEEEEEVEDYFEYEYADIYEKIMTQAIKYCGEGYNLTSLRMELFRDIVVAMRCFVKSEIVGDLPRLKRIDPRNVVFDTTAEDPFLTDSTYFGIVDYMSIADAAEQYGIDKSELKEIYERSTGNNAIGSHAFNLDIGSGSTVTAFRQEGNELKTLVFTAYWQDTKPFNYKESKDKHGNEHVKLLKDKEEKDKENSKVTKKNIKIWRKGTIIANHLIKDWGEVENSPRKIDNISDTVCPVQGVIPGWINQRSVSLVDQLKGLQDLKNIAFYNIQLAMARAGGSGFVYDIAQTPEDWEPETVLKYLKNTGIAFIDSKKDGTPNTFNQFSKIDLSLSPSIQYYLEISRIIDQEMDSISGVNEAREGTIASSSQTVGVTQSALIQSNLKTKMLYSYFDNFMNNSLNHQAGLVKIAWENKEVFAPIIGDIGVDFLKNEIDVDLQDYSLFIEYIPTILRDKESLQSLVMAAIQSQQISLVDAMKILKEKDTVMAINKFEKSIMKREKKMQEQAMAQQQAEQQAQAQMQQQQLQAQAQMQEQKNQAEGLKMQGNKDIALAKGKIDLLKSLK